MRFLPLLLLLPLAACDPALESGRQGNGLFEMGQYAESVLRYEEGLNHFTDSLPSRTRAALHYNTGLARHAEGNAQEAIAAFTRSGVFSVTAEQRAHAEYNAGVAAFDASQHEQALAHFRTALRARAPFEDASYNWEFVRRQMQENEQQGDEGSSDEQQNPQPDQQGENQEGQDGQEGQQNPQNQPNDQQQGENQEGQQDEGESEQEERSERSRQQPQQDPRRLTEQEAQRILQAIGSEEEQLLRQQLRPDTPRRRVEKDW